jgi:hypothetical protein
VWTAERDEDARKLAAQQQEFNENPGPHTMLALSTQCLTSLWH